MIYQRILGMKVLACGILDTLLAAGNVKEIIFLFQISLRKRIITFSLSVKRKYMK